MKKVKVVLVACVFFSVWAMDEELVLEPPTCDVEYSTATGLADKNDSDDCILQACETIMGPKNSFPIILIGNAEPQDASKGCEQLLAEQQER